MLKGRRLEFDINLGTVELALAQTQLFADFQFFSGTLHVSKFEIRD